VLLGWWLLDEQVGPRTLLAGTIIAVAVALIVLPRKQQETTEAVPADDARAGRRGNA